MGNRETQDKFLLGLLTSDTYTYDDANRIATVNNVSYDYDANGNLENDGVNAYDYDSANRLVSFSNATTTVTYQYRCNGESIGQFGCESDRVSQTVNGVTTNYVLDLASPLTQVLQDGTNTYVYGVDRIAQMNGGIPEYFLTDGLGSVRQLVDSNGNITLAKSYQPYGTQASSAGSGLSSYGFTGEMTDSYIKLIYLRSRLYDPLTGRFTTKDSWQGDYNRPLSLNRWLYVEANPINYTDPTGQCPQGWIKNSNGTCSFTLFPSLPGGGVIITVPDPLSWLFCEDQNQQLFPIYSTPTATPQPATPTPGSLYITPTPGSLRVTPTLTNTPSPQYTKIKVYRGLKGTAPSDIKPRIDSPEKELMELGAIGSFSVFEQTPPNFGFTHELPFEITYQEPKTPGRIGTVVGLVAGEVIFSGGIALYSPDPSIPIYGEGHWSITVVGLSKDELRNKVAEYGKKYFGK